jgi:phospholipid/cholesterol/gamma-HCH transport system permease protein
MLDGVGRSVVGVGTGLLALIDMAGAVIAAWLRVFVRPRQFRLTSTVHHLEQVCWRAVPIVVLITFLIGCIVAQQGIFHFRKFGADVFVVDMLGLLVLRELGVLLVAIMVAGRSGSAYTAELGSMKMREEIDALRTMGFDPIEVLILPRMIALVIGLPILTFLGGMAALYGGGLVAWLYGGVDPEAFLSRLRDAISINHFLVGMIKAPVMALVIGIVACVEGLAVQGSAESLGQHTTASVVKGIFLVIVMDGVFAVFFASIGI